MEPYSVRVQAADAKNKDMTTGGENIVCVVENEMKKWVEPGTRSGSQRHSLRRILQVQDNLDGRVILDPQIYPDGSGGTCACCSRSSSKRRFPRFCWYQGSFL